MKRLMSLLLAGILIFSLVPAQVLATDRTADTEPSEETTEPTMLLLINPANGSEDQSDPIEESKSVWTVTFDAKGGTPAPSEQNVTNGETATEPDEPQKDNFIFGGWYHGDTPWKFSEPVNGDMELTADWLDAVTVTFDTDGGLPVPDPQTIEKGTTACEPEGEFTNDGFVFDGWTDSEGNEWTFGEKTVDTDTILYAKWLIKVTFMDGDTVFDEVDLENNSKITETDILPKTDYALAGLYTDANLNEPWDYNTPITQPIKLYTKWTPTVTVTFNTDGKATVEPQTFAQGGTVTPPTTPTNDNYEFAGWFTDTSFNTPFDFAEPVNGNTTVYAKWLKKITVTFVTGVGDRQIVHYTQTLVEGDTITKPADPPRGDYILHAWYTTSSCTTEYVFGSTVTKDSTDTTIYARWEAEVTFDSNKGTPVGSQTVLTGAKLEEPKNVSRGNCELEGWYTNKNWTTEWKFDSNTVDRDNLVLYAKWLADVTFDLNYTGSAEPQTETVIADTLFATSAEPSRDGYEFAGWYDKDGNEWESGKTPVTDDITLYAKWSVIVTFSPSTVALYPGEDKSITCKVGDTTLTSTVNNLQWSVSGNKDTDTKINKTSGVLTVGEDETASTLTVTVTGTYGSDFVDASLSVTVKPIYEFKSGSGGKWAQKSTKNLTFECNGPMKEISYEGIMIDSKPVKEENYTHSESTYGFKLVLKSAAMKDLSVKKHTLTITFDDGGKAETTFEVIKESDIPETGDALNLPLWVALMGVTTAAALMLLKKRSF